MVLVGISLHLDPFQEGKRSFGKTAHSCLCSYRQSYNNVNNVYIRSRMSTKLLDHFRYLGKGPFTFIYICVFTTHVINPEVLEIFWYWVFLGEIKVKTCMKRRKHIVLEPIKRNVYVEQLVLSSLLHEGDLYRDVTRNGFTRRYKRELGFKRVSTWS